MRNHEFGSLSTRIAVMVIAMVLSSCSTYPRERPAGAIHATDATTSDGAFESAPASTLFSRDKIFDAMRTRSTATKNLIMVAAHRGYWETYPENSLGAIYEAGLHYEIVEADVKPAKGGYPVIFHDLYLSRVTTGKGPLIDIDVADFLKLKLRDRFGKAYEHSEFVKPMTVEMLLESYASWLVKMLEGADYDPSNRPGFVLALDVKGATPEEAWPMVKEIFKTIVAVNSEVSTRTGYKNLLTNAILIKIAAGSLPENPTVVHQLISGNPKDLLNICVVVNAKDDPLAPERVAAYSHETFVSTFEVVVKHKGDPDMKFVKSDEIDTTVGNFLVYYDFPTGVGNSKALCCSTLSTDPNNADKYIDYRARWGWFSGRRINTQRYPHGMNVFSILTIDRPDLLVSFLESIDMRNLNIIKWKPIHKDRTRSQDAGSQAERE